ncbi:exported hypothetical protein [uncultured Gammaproteobacteria bacterium]
MAMTKLALICAIGGCLFAVVATAADGGPYLIETRSQVEAVFQDKDNKAAFQKKWARKPARVVGEFVRGKGADWFGYYNATILVDEKNKGGSDRSIKIICAVHKSDKETRTRLEHFQGGTPITLVGEIGYIDYHQRLNLYDCKFPD